MSNILDAIKTWWPLVTVILTISTTLSTGLIYYAKAETRTLIKDELTAPLDSVREQIDETQDKLHDLQQQNSASQAKIDLMIQMMMKQNQVLDAQTKSIQELPQKVK
jgi:response regulator of citrate/malate metabolism